jgi:uncharacterized membrane protein YhaH (DUF805 family)
MDWRTLFFSFRGRLNRAKYWLALLIGAIISAVCVVTMATLMNGLRMGIYGGAGGIMAAIALSVIVLIVVFCSSLAIAFKRLHDRNKSGVWLLLFWLAPSVLNAIGQSIGANWCRRLPRTGGRGAYDLRTCRDRISEGHHRPERLRARPGPGVTAPRRGASILRQRPSTHRWTTMT